MVTKKEKERYKVSYGSFLATKFNHLIEVQDSLLLQIKTGQPGQEEKLERIKELTTELKDLIARNFQ